jgi:ABC-type bacteriocin/lantibiotic exporter with double-glycine peptidase domain
MKRESARFGKDFAIAVQMARATNRANWITAVISSGVFSIVSVASALILKALVDTALAGHLPDLYVLIAVSVIYMVVYLLVSFTSARVANRFLTTAVTNLRRALISSAMNRRDVLRVGDVASEYLEIFSRDLEISHRDYLTNTISIPQRSVALVAGIGTMVLLDPLIFASLAVAAALSAVVMGLAGRRATFREQELSQTHAAFGHRLKDLVSGLSTIRAYQSESWAARLLFKDSTDLGRASSMTQSGRDRTRIVAEFCTHFVVLAVFSVGVAQTILGNTTIGTLVAFVQLLNYVVMPIQLLPQEVGDLRTARASMTRIGAAIKGASEAQLDQFGSTVVSPVEHIALRNVSYRYPGASRDVISGFSYRFQAGQSYAIVGSSGSGKSTLLKLLQRFDLSYDGAIELDGVELRDADDELIARHLSVVHQDLYIFDASIRENIAVFQPFEEKAILLAAQAAGLADLIERSGLDYSCGEHGQALSGGEKQRIGIARAFLRSSSVMLLDEITSSLDNETSRSIESTVAGWGTSTRIVVTHRIDEESMRNFDAILMISAGALVEDGPFETLMARGGAFSAMYTTRVPAE